MYRGVGGGARGKNGGRDPASSTSQPATLNLEEASLALLFLYNSGEPHLRIPSYSKGNTLSLIELTIS